MIPRIIKLEYLSAAEKEMLSVGTEKAGIKLMAPKAVSRVVKLRDVNSVAANIIKQEMLSLGGEAATGRGAINLSQKVTDLLIFGTLKHYSGLIAKLKMSYFKLPQIAAEIEKALKAYDRKPADLKIGRKNFRFGRRTYLMGILNLTPDSFSDGGRFFTLDRALAQAEQMAEDGADIIDIGGESTRPGARPVPAEEEKRRVLPVIQALARRRSLVLSVDTRKAEVAKAALEAGAHMVNDISGLRHDRKMAGLIAKYRTPLCIMHIQGNPQTMQRDPSYQDLMGEVIEYLNGGLEIAKKAGILQEKIIVDPGIGFGKSAEDNLEIIRRLKELKVLGCPILIGPSRKSFIGKVLKATTEERLEGTAAVAALSIANGADIIRVHDIRAIKKISQMADSIIRRE